MMRLFNCAAGSALLLLLSSVANAGHYELIEQKGGKQVQQGGAAQQDYSDLPGGYGGGAGAGSDYCKCAGTITTVFEFRRDYPGEALPANVIIREGCDATATTTAYGGASGTATVTNDLGDTPTNTTTPIYSNGILIGTSYSASVTGIRYKVVAGQEKITVQCTPRAYAETSSGNASSSVRYRVAAAPVMVSVGGTKMDSSSPYQKILVGQRATGFLFCAFPEVTFSNHSWNVPGETYARWPLAPDPVDQNSVQVVPVPGTEWSKPSPAWRWKEKSQVGTYTIQCTATATVSGEPNFSVAGQRLASCHYPNSSFTSLGSVVTYDAQERVQAYDPVTDYPGMAFGGRVGTPPLFIVGPDAGVWNFGQVVDYYRETISSNGASNVRASYGYHLDNSWPYGYQMPGFGATTFSAYPETNSSGQIIGTLGITEDSPAHTLINTVEYLVTDSFKMYQMYRPPTNNNGTSNDPASDWVPLRRFNWSWNANDSRPSTGVPFPTTHPGAVNSGGVTAYPEFPSWSYRATNG